MTASFTRPFPDFVAGAEAISPGLGLHAATALYFGWFTAPSVWGPIEQPDWFKLGTELTQSDEEGLARQAYRAALLILLTHPERRPESERGGGWLTDAERLKRAVEANDHETIKAMSGSKIDAI
jgi:hypothetical protein